MDNQQFNQLFRKYTDGTCTPEEREAFFDMVQHRQHDEQLTAMLDQLYAEGKIVKPRKIISYTRWAAAAAVAALIATGTWMYTSKSTPAVTNTIAVAVKLQTASKEQKFIVLPDSTKIWLNGASVVSYPKEFNKDKREIYLEGEAYFDVKQAASWPFVIHSPGDITTTVLGTAFNIKAYPGHKQVVVSVAEGKVQVSRGKEDLLTLIKGQELRLAYNTVEQRDVVPVQIAAWQKGDYNFTDETLGDIIKDLQVYYGVTIRLENTRLTDLQLTTGIKKNTSVDSALANICELANANYTKKNDVYVVY